jgi:hypothetical protein
LFHGVVGIAPLLHAVVLLDQQRVAVPNPDALLYFSARLVQEAQANALSRRGVVLHAAMSGGGNCESDED